MEIWVYMSYVLIQIKRSRKLNKKEIRVESIKFTNTLNNESLYFEGRFVTVLGLGIAKSACIEFVKVNSNQSLCTYMCLSQRKFYLFGPIRWRWVYR